MIPALMIRNTKERYRLNIATDTICSLCRDDAPCTSCAVSELRRGTEESIRGIAHMDCCSMQPPDYDPELLRRYSEALDHITSKVGDLGLLSLPEEDKEKLKRDHDLESKVMALEMLASKL